MTIKMIYCLYQDSNRDIPSNIPLTPGTPSGKGFYLTVYPSSRPNMDTIYLLMCAKQHYLHIYLFLHISFFVVVFIVVVFFVVIMFVICFVFKIVFVVIVVVDILVVVVIIVIIIIFCQSIENDKVMSLVESKLDQGTQLCRTHLENK